MSMHPDPRDDDSDRDRHGSLPVLRGWWSELSAPGKILIPTSAAVLVFVAGSAIPPFVL